MDLEVEIKEEPVWLERTGSSSLDAYSSNPVVDNCIVTKVNDAVLTGSEHVMKVEHFELLSGMMPLKQETKSELTEPGPTQEYIFELTPEVKGEIFIEEHAIDQAVPCIKERNKLENVPVLTQWPLLSCDSCSKSYKAKSALKRHSLIHTREKLYQCGVCSFSFPDKCKQKDHEFTHSNERLFCCTLCSSTFARKCLLLKHKLTHSGERPYRCSTCNLTFSRKFTLDFHVLTHSGKRPYSCSLCKNAFNQKSHLNTHMLTHSGERS